MQKNGRIKGKALHMHKNLQCTALRNLGNFPMLRRGTVNFSTCVNRTNRRHIRPRTGKYRGAKYISAGVFGNSNIVTLPLFWCAVPIFVLV